MYKNYEKLFAHLQPAEPPADLFDGVMNSIRKEQRFLMAKRRITLVLVGLLGSIGAYIPAWKIVRVEFTKSGFLQFFSLVFSDFSIVVSNVQDFALVLLESLPVLGVTVFMGSIFLLLAFLKYTVDNLRIIIAFRQRNMNIEA
jgi:hypothetical protein